MDSLSLTVYEALAAAARERGDATAMAEEGRRISFAELARRAEDLARGLAGLGVRPGDRVALWLSNCIEWALVQLACARLGAPVVAINTRLKGKELAYILGHSGAKLLISGRRAGHTDTAAIAREVLACHPLPALERLVMADTLNTLPPGDLPPLPAPDAPLSILYTSGTTAAPKGGVRTHRNVVFHAAQALAFAGMGPGGAHCALFPYCGAAGQLFLLGTLFRGARVVIPASQDAEDIFRAVARERCTLITGMDALFHDMCEHPARERYDLSSLRMGGMGWMGAGSAQQFNQEIEARLGFQMCIPYGLTEANAAVLWTLPDDPPEWRGAVGGRPPSPHIQVRLSATGEILIKGPNVMPGYYLNPEATREAIDSEGWLHTGDLGVAGPGGLIFFVSRLKDVLKLKGFNVSPVEIEEVLQQHPAVDLAQVVGAQAAREEVAVAFVRLKPGHAATEEELRQHCRGSVASYKVPARVVQVERFPVTEGPHGDKIQKSRLRQQAAELIGG